MLKSHLQETTKKRKCVNNKGMEKSNPSWLTAQEFAPSWFIRWDHAVSIRAEQAQT